MEILNKFFTKNNVENKKKYQYRYHEQYIKNSNSILRQKVSFFLKVTFVTLLFRSKKYLHNNNGNSDKFFIRK